MVKDQKKYELTDLIKWKFQNGTFFLLTLYILFCYLLFKLLHFPKKLRMLGALRSLKNKNDFRLKIEILSGLELQFKIVNSYKNKNRHTSKQVGTISSYNRPYFHKVIIYIKVSHISIKIFLILSMSMILHFAWVI